MGKRHRHERADTQWAKIRRLLPGKQHDPGRPALDNCLFVDAVVFVLETGIPWADLPSRSGKSDTVRKRYDRWCARGVWQKIAAATGEADLEEVQLDATTIKAGSRPMLASLVPPDRRDRLPAHPTDPRSFGRPHPVPTPSADTDVRPDRRLLARRRLTEHKLHGAACPDRNRSQRARP